jgi:CheY-like chemotaxis protein/HPt (histidine-containing phosphotransfer) domain-containing protein
MSAGKEMHILLVEDDLTNQQVALGLLNQLGMVVDVASNGVEAIKVLEKSEFDLVLMDVQMPEMGGLETTRYIRNVQSTVLDHALPIIAMTALAFQGDRERCLDAGMNDYVSKPIDWQMLAEVLNRWLPDKTGKSPLSSQAKKTNEEALTKEKQTLVFDQAALERRLMDDKELANKVIAGFLWNIPQQIQMLKNYLEAGDITSAEQKAHAIKGASSSINAEVLRGLAFEIEKNGRSGDLGAMNRLMPDLETQFEVLKEVLKKVI